MNFLILGFLLFLPAPGFIFSQHIIMETHSMNENKGADVYTPFTLKLYDFWVLGFSNRFAWKCPTRRYLLPHFREHLSGNHLDIGVGTGYYLARSGGSSSLMDLNTSSLNATSSRLGKAKIHHKIHHDVLTPFPGCFHNHFDSVSLFFLLHCLPGNTEAKKKAIAHSAQALTPDGTLSGATILGERVKHNFLGRSLMRFYNHKGIFSNRADSEEELREILSAYFLNVDIRVKGTVALFFASGKKLIAV